MVQHQHTPIIFPSRLELTARDYRWSDDNSQTTNCYLVRLCEVYPYPAPQSDGAAGKDSRRIRQRTTISTP